MGFFRTDLGWLIRGSVSNPQLGAPHRGVKPTITQEPGVSAALYDPSLIQNKNFVRVYNCRQAVCDSEFRYISQDVTHSLANPALCGRVKGRSCFVEYKNPRAP
jgi:hypothetical protein